MGNFKATVEETVKRKIANEILSEQGKADVLTEQKRVASITSQFSDTLLVEKVIHKIKEQMADDFRKELEDGLSVQIAESVRAEVTETVTRQLKAQLDERVIDSNERIIDVINKLASKLDKLSESLNIEVPTPIVHINMPKITRKVNRNESGLVESITDNFDEDEKE